MEIYMYIPPPQTTEFDLQNFQCNLINILSYCKVKKVKH